MMTARLQLFATLLAVAFLAGMIELIRKRRGQLKYALLWLFSGVMMLILALFPGLLDWAAGLLGVYDPVNALFAVMLCLGFALMISFSVIMSGNKKNLVRLTQEIALLEKRVRELEAERDGRPERREEKA